MQRSATRQIDGDKQVGHTKHTSYSPAPRIARPARFLERFWRDLISSAPAASRLFLADLKTKHRRAILGYIWLVLPGLAMAIGFAWLRRSELFMVRDTAIAYPLFVLSGLFLWQTFIDGLSLPLRQVEQYRHILGSVRVPHEPLLLASLLKGALNALIRLSMVAIVAWFFGAGIGAISGAAAAFAVILFLGWGMGLCMVPIGLLYDDIGRAITIGSLLGIFVCPIAFVIPGDSILSYNPLIPLFDTARASLNASFDLGNLIALLIGLAIALIFFFVGGALYRLAQPHLIAAFR